MDKILRHLQDIRSLTPRKDSVISETISKKYYSFSTISDILNDLGQYGDKITLSREDIFNEPDTRKRIVKALIWGYPNDVRNAPGIIESLDHIVDFVNAYDQNKDGLHLLIELLGTDRMGLCVVSRVSK